LKYYLLASKDCTVALTLKKRLTTIKK